MYELETTSHFRKKYQKLVLKDKNIQNKILKALEVLRKDPRYPSLKTHKVHIQKFEDVYSSYVTGDIRMIWEKIDDKQTLLLLDIGGHSGKQSVYK